MCNGYGPCIRDIPGGSDSGCHRDHFRSISLKYSILIRLWIMSWKPCIQCTCFSRLSAIVLHSIPIIAVVRSLTSSLKGGCVRIIRVVSSPPMKGINFCCDQYFVELPHDIFTRYTHGHENYIRSRT